MTTPADATEALIARVRAAARDDSSAAVKSALIEVLTDLDVSEDHAAWTDGRDVIGAAYERLVAGRLRRRLGQFFTPLAIGRVMARWALAANPDLLLEPGCGSGSLLAAAANERTTVARMLGIDVDPFAIAMAAANRDVRGIKSLELRIGDFLVDNMDERPEAVLCNPPYTRHHALDGSYKAAIHRGFERRLGRRFSQLASLHVLFLVRALEVSSDNARLAFITPSHWLDMNYAREVKKVVLGQAHVEAILSFATDHPVFEHALTTASITLISKGVEDGSTRVIRADSSSADALAAQLEDPEVGERVFLTSSRKWSRLNTPSEAASKLRLGDFARIRRGVATGFNSFFVLSERQRRDLQLDASSVRPCVASPRHFAVDQIDLAVLDSLPDTTARWLLRPTQQRQRGPLARYLDHGDRVLGVRERRIVKQREQAGRRWFEVEADVTAPILFTYFNRSRARFVRNRAEAVPLNTWLVIEPKAGVDPDALFDLLRSDEVSERVSDDRRIYGKGLWKLEPSELKDLPLPRRPAP